jgi:predicted solute-binding protein
MSSVRLGAVEYLNARPLVYGLGDSPRFSIRFDVPSRCADLLHAGEIDVGLIPSIEYVRGRGPYAVVPGVAIASRGPVASVAIYTTKPMSDVRTLALDTSSRSSVALARVLCAKAFDIAPSFRAESPNLERMLSASDAALIIGDTALFLDRGVVSRGGHTVAVEKIDLGDVWTKSTGLPFVYAFWAGRPDALDREDVAELLSAKRIRSRSRRSTSATRPYARKPACGTCGIISSTISETRSGRASSCFIATPPKSASSNSRAR